MHLSTGGHDILMPPRRLVPMIDAATPSARMVLRGATDEIHQRMHRHGGFAQLAAGTIVKHDYCRLLARSHGFHAMAARFVHVCIPLAGLLDADLLALGMSRGGIAALPQSDALGLDGSVPAQIGATYVVLGAALGGGVMARAIGHRMWPTGFLRGQSDAIPKWPAFLAEVELALSDTESRLMAAKAAVAAFVAYETWMDGWLTQ